MKISINKSMAFKPFGLIISVLFIAIVFDPVGRLLSAKPGVVYAMEEEMPFRPGETLRYKISWGKIPAGEALIAVLPVKKIDNEESLHFRFTARTNSFVDIFYKVRDQIDSYVDLNISRSLLYKKKQKEGSTRRNIVVNFNWEKLLAQYSDKGKKRDPISLLPGTLDPLSAFYYTRIADLQLKKQVEAPVTDGKKCVIGYANIKRRETITIESGKYDTYMIEPELKHISGVFKKSKNAKVRLWLTADKYRIPVKMESKVIVGSFVAELVTSKEQILAKR